MKVKQKYWKGVNKSFQGAVLVLVAFGLFAVSSASAVMSDDRYGNTNYYFFRHLIFVAVGLACMYIFSRIDYRLWKRLSTPLILFGLFLLAIVLIPGLGPAAATARRWINAGFFLIQPSEFFKLFSILYLASWFERKEGAENNFWFGVIPPLILVGIGLGLIVIEPDVGTAAVTAVLIGAVLFVGGARLRYLLLFAFLGSAGLWLLVKAAPYRAARILTFMNPSKDPLGISYHINQALLAIGSGGFWGYGLGAGRQKHNYLPEPMGDSIFAVVSEELGFITVVAVVLVFLFLAFVGVKIASQAPDKFGKLTAAGITAWIVLQAFINIAAISGLMPLTGVALPFISYGGSSMLALSVATGIVLNISRQRI